MLDDVQYTKYTYMWTSIRLYVLIWKEGEEASVSMGTV